MNEPDESPRRVEVICDNAAAPACPWPAVMYIRTKGKEQKKYLGSWFTSAEALRLHNVSLDEILTVLTDLFELKSTEGEQT